MKKIKNLKEQTDSEEESIMQNDIEEHHVINYDKMTLMMFTLYDSALMMEEELSLIKYEILKQCGTTVNQILSKYLEIKSKAEMNDELRWKFKVIRECILNSVRMNIVIENKAGISNEIIEPIGMDYKNGKYYLVANSVGKNQYNYYNLDDIKFIHNQQERFQDYGCINLAVKQCSADKWFSYEGQPVSVKVKLFREGKNLLLNRGNNIDIKHVSSCEDYDLYELTAYGYDEIKAFLLGCGNALEVLEPLELKDQIQNSITQLMKIYK